MLEDKFMKLKTIEIDKVSDMLMPYLAEAMKYAGKKDIKKTRMNNPVDHAYLLIGLKRLKYDLLPGLIEFAMAEEAFLDTLVLFETKIKAKLSVDDVVSEILDGSEYKEILSILKSVDINMHIEEFRQGFSKTLNFLVQIKALVRDEEGMLSITEDGQAACDLWKGYLNVGVS